MLTCETCGEIVPEGTQYCPNCGARLSGGGPPVPDAPDSFAPDTADVPEDFGTPQIPRKALPHRHRKHRTLPA